MVRRLGSILQILVGLAVLLALIVGVGWIVYSTIARAPVVVAAVVTGLAALMGVPVQRYLEHQREDARERRNRMAPIYEELLKTFYSSAAGGALDQSELLSFFEDLARSLLIWGSEPVIVAFNRWRVQVAALEEGSPDALFAFEDLLYAIRADLGNESKNMGRGDLLRVFVNDIDEFLPAGDEIAVTDRPDVPARDTTGGPTR